MLESFLSPHLCGYRKGYSTQTALISMLEKWKLSIDNEGFAGGVLMDLSKVFDTTNHQLTNRQLWIQQTGFRSSRSQTFFKIGVLKNFANFTGKHLCWSLFLIKWQA